MCVTAIGGAPVDVTDEFRGTDIADVENAHPSVRTRNIGAVSIGDGPVHLEMVVARVKGLPFFRIILFGAG